MDINIFDDTFGVAETPVNTDKTIPTLERASFQLQNII